MSSRKNKARFSLGLILFVLVLVLYKSQRLTTEMGADWYTFFILVGLDAFYLALLTLIAILQSYVGVRLLRLFLWFALVVMAAIYLVDSFVLLALDEHAALFDIGRYSLEPGVVLSFFDVTAYAAIALFLVSLFLVPLRGPKFGKFSFYILSVLVMLAAWGVAVTPGPLSRYSMLNPVILLEGLGPQSPNALYSDEQIAFYAGLSREPAEIPASHPDIILLVIESLSSINSEKVSGLAGFLGGFDQLAGEGVLFRNFFANHQASEGGVIALLGGHPPMYFPTATPYMFDEFAVQPSITAEYRKAGYFTDFLTNSDLGFIGLNHFLDGLGFDRSRGRDEVDAMRAAPRIVQDAPSDALLYEEALVAIKGLSLSRRPFLLTIATTSTHLPYTHPESGPDTPEAVWDWSMRRLIEFYRQLSASGYFEQGILLITGDHRQMRPLNESETRRYGGSARARVPLLVIGQAYPPGTLDDRFYQQSDLLRLLGRVQEPKTRLSPHPVWVERYNRKYGRIELIDNLSVFDESDQGRHEYRLKVPGNRIEWQGEKPGFAREVETRIHTQRSLHQRIRGESIK